jgi:hypothetical protein
MIEVVCIVIAILFAALLVSVYYNYKKLRAHLQGIASNPPNIIEVAQRKPLIIKIDDKFNFVIGYDGAIDTIIYLSRIQTIFQQLIKCREITDTKAAEKAIQAVYISLAVLLYNISYKNIDKNKRKAYKRALLTKCIESTQWTYDVCAEIRNFNMLIKKKEQLAAAADTLAMKHGARYSWDTWMQCELQRLKS